MRKRRAVLKPHGGAAFKIGREQQGDARGFLQKINQGSGGIRLAALDSEGPNTRAQHEAANVVLFDGSLQLAIFRAFQRCEFSVKGQHEKLPKLFLEAHFGKGALDPRFRAGRKAVANVLTNGRAWW
jgi:hypothetical protein